MGDIIGHTEPSGFSRQIICVNPPSEDEEMLFSD
jgi:hypothetical protein